VLHVISRRSRDVTPSDLSLWRTVDDIKLQRMRENRVEAIRGARSCWKAAIVVFEQHNFIKVRNKVVMITVPRIFTVGHGCVAIS